MSPRPSSVSRTGLLREFSGCNPRNLEPRGDQEHRIARPSCLSNPLPQGSIFSLDPAYNPIFTLNQNILNRGGAGVAGESN